MLLPPFIMCATARNRSLRTTLLASTKVFCTITAYFISCFVADFLTGEDGRRKLYTGFRSSGHSSDDGDSLSVSRDHK